MTKEKTKKDMSGVAHGMKMSLAKTKNDFIRNTINGRYFFERCNMIADQVINDDIKESIDGCLKPKSFLMSEYALQKMQAINSMREAHFAKLELKKQFNMTDEDVGDILKDYYDGKIIRDTYDEAYKKGKTAEFVKE